MRRISLHICLLAVAAILLQADKCSNAVPLTCNTVAVVKDYTGLDGCDILLVVSEDLKLLPINLDTQDVQVADGDIVLIGYTVREDAASICMAEDAIVELHCIQQGPGLRASDECVPVVDPYRQDWSLAVMKEIQPFRITEYLVGKVRLYQFHSVTENRLYGCSGQLICSYLPGKDGECKPYLAGTGEGTIIFVEDQ